MVANLLLSGDNDNVVQLLGLKNGIDDRFINTATVTATVREISGLVIHEAAMTYIANSKGCYLVQLNHSLNLVNGQYYTVTIKAEFEGLNASWEQCIKATARI